MKDQFGNEIPYDLVFIQKESDKDLNYYDLHKIMNAAWYELTVSGGTILCASKLEINSSRDEFVFSLIQEEEIKTAQIRVINDAQKRFNIMEGFFVN